ncbi:putative NBD/HSP70 family sugar kinase [Nocardiopsis mwathae]|uniref:Putative NBD/HSP70 family sugar kinase n=1 Tax=Nocardiopsis mwathae TaxID=1472723 RepID=A0A7X0D5J8_9ACTN|nr:ROK family transcriptional regulator [Nocardiopsis mwathae]MBB6171756.1 putative NBD/HSP70 family sugar kinase [Nocardiopsis mwathae]
MPRSTAPSPSNATSGHVLRLIRTGDAATRTEIGRLTGLSRPAVAARLTELMSRGLVSEGSQGPSSGGRPPGRLEFNASGGVVLTAALGISRSQIAVCDLAGHVLAHVGGSPQVEQGPAAAVPWLLDTWEELLAKAGRSTDDVWGAGIGVPGTVEFATGRAASPPVLASWGGVEIRPLIAERFPVPVMLDNDVNVMALGEHWARHRDTVDDLIFVKVSTGIGAGIVSDGAILRGSLGAAGEIGHIPVQGDGTPCRCGNTDCLEAVAGGPALLRQLAAQDRNVTGIRELAALAQEGDPEAVRLVRDAGRRIGEVLAGAVNLLNPAVIVLGGDLALAYDHLVAGVREVVFQRSTALATRQLRIVPSRLWDDAGPLGCAVMVLDRLLAPEAIDTELARR